MFDIHDGTPPGGGGGVQFLTQFPTPCCLQLNNKVRVLDTRTGNVSTVAGGAGFMDGVGTAARFNWPKHMALSNEGDSVFIADRWVSSSIVSY